jgi:hypothetical protein
LAQRMSYVIPPRPCTGTRPSDAQLLRGRPAGGLAAPYGTTPLPEGLIEYVAQYRSVEALATYFDELIADVARCPGQIGLAGDRSGWQWSIQDSGFAGDQSLLIRIRAELHYGNTSQACCFDNYIAVARQGTILVATTSRGWEAASGTADIAKRWLATGLQRAQSALR